MEKFENGSKAINNENEINKFDEATKGLKVEKTNVIITRNNFQCEKKIFCSDDVKKHVSILLILIFFTMMLGSFVVFSYITFTNKFNENIVENLVLKNGSKALEWWIDSPLKPLLKVHIFNYTNIDEVLKGRAKKIKVQDVGPYVYEEKAQRVRLSWLDGDKITSYENRTQTFSTKHTPKGLNEDDKLMVPNVPLILAINKVDKDTTAKIGFKLLLSSTNPDQFQVKTVNEFLFGYLDPFVNALSMASGGLTKEKIGILGSRRGLSTDNLTIYTGEKDGEFDLENLGKIYAMNGETDLNMWSDEKCNEIVGTDGSQFPPDWMDRDRTLDIFIKSICKPFPIKYEEEVTVFNGLPALRYRPTPNVFGNSIVNPDNKCYCDAENPRENCPPSGVFDSEKCVGVSILMSYPHFYEGDEILLEPFEGLEPVAEKHATFADIHHRMAFPIGGASRLQVNVRVKKLSYGLNFFSQTHLFKNLPDELILPLCWFELTAGEVPPELMSMIFNTTHSANTLYLTIQYGSIICMFVSFLALLFTSCIYYKKISGRGDNEDVASHTETETKRASETVVYMRTQQTEIFT